MPVAKPSTYSAQPDWRRQLRYQILKLLLRRQHLLADGLPFDMRFRFRTPDDVGRHIYKYRIYEPHLFALLQELEKPPSATVCLDIGANIGWYTVLFGRLFGPQVEVCAFEPDPENRALLEENLRLNQAQQVRVAPRALSDHAGPARLHRYRDINLGKHSLRRQPGSRDSIDVQTQTLDDYLAAAGLASRPVAVMKVDVEGHEPEVIAGAAQTLSRVQHLLLEYSPMYYQQAAAAQMLDTLWSCGLRPQLFRQQAWHAVTADELLGLRSQHDTAWQRP